MNPLIAVAGQFTANEILNIQEYGHGNVNDTFLVTLNSGAEKFILQRISARVFSRPELITANMRALTQHVDERLKQEPAGSGHRWELPRILAAQDGKDYFLDSQAAFWRATSFIPNSRTYETIQSTEHAQEAGYTLGKFHNLVSDLETNKLHDTLPGFHITPRYLKQYDRVQARNHTSPEAKHCAQFIARRRDWASVLEKAKEGNKLSLRPIHGDPKINNIMMDNSNGRAVGIIDLDTVKPGLVHYDIGDCLRSCCNPLGEETHNVKGVHFNADLCRAILQGYLAAANGFLGQNDYLYLYDATRLIAFELGLRFFTDYLAGNVYFKAKHQEHNLARALVQFQLTKSIESQEADIRTLIDALTPPSAANGVG